MGSRQPLTTLYRQKLSLEQYSRMELWGRRVFVENVPPTQSEESLLSTFGQFGLILELTYVRKDATAFIVYSTIQEAVTAIEQIDYLRFPGSNPRIPTRGTPGKDAPFFKLERTGDNLTVDDLEYWLNSVNEPGSITSVRYLHGRFEFNFATHHLAHRFKRNVDDGTIDLKLICGQNAVLKFRNFPVFKLKRVPPSTTKEEILAQFNLEIQESIKFVAQRGRSVFIYMESEQAFAMTRRTQHEGIYLRVNGELENFQLYSFD